MSWCNCIFRVPVTSATSPLDDFRYQCVISSETGESRSEAFLSVEGPSDFQSSPPKDLVPEIAKTFPPRVLKPPSDSTVFVGEAVTLRCTMDGSPSMKSLIKLTIYLKFLLLTLMVS